MYEDGKVRPTDLYDNKRQFIIDDNTGQVIANIVNRNIVFRREVVSRTKAEEYRSAILKNEKLVQRYNITEDSFRY